MRKTNWPFGQALPFALALCFCSALGAQPTAEFGLYGGVAGYMGDLTPGTLPPSSTLSPAYGLRFGWHWRYAWQLRAQATRLQLSGSDASFTDPVFTDLRGFSFESTLTEAALHLVWEPFARRRYPGKGGYRSVWSPYLFAGLGRADFQPEPRFGPHADNGYRERVAQDKASLPPTGRWVIPMGGGLNIDLGKSVSLGLEANLVKANTDYVDGISQAGNPGSGDWYASAGLTLTYRWSKRDFDRDGILDVADACPREAGTSATGGCPDADGDGIIDMEDMCPYQTGTLELRGCPDDDFDGVADLLDKCPDYPGHLSAEGCPDADGDGLADNDDLCPDCPGDAADQGCPDADADGLPDHKDRCPRQAGPWDRQGCPFVDDDGDGLPNEADNCPQQAGPLGLRGCPDTDGDGLADPQDRCPELAGTPANKGCPEVPEEVIDAVKLAAEDVRFETGSDRLRAASFEKLNELAGILQEYPYIYLRIEGHTDNQGAAQENQRLSENRAKACYSYLTEQHIAAERMRYEGFGEAQPIADNRTAEGRRQNRRVVFALYVP